MLYTKNSDFWDVIKLNRNYCALKSNSRDYIWYRRCHVRLYKKYLALADGKQRAFYLQPLRKFAENAKVVH